VLTLGADLAVGLFGDAAAVAGHVHDHDRPASRNADVEEAARGGASFALADAIVEGKITVVDS
jgi:hypothetical protein